MGRVLGVLAALAIVGPAVAQPVGFQRVTIPGETSMNVGLWYPTADRMPPEPNTPFRQSLALGGSIDGENLPLIVISHGDGGWMGSHAGTALALARGGYAVAALEHLGNNSEDESRTPSEWVESRPADVVALLDFLLEDWEGAETLDPERIGMFGFSAGGYTGLVAAGAEPDFRAGVSFCDDNDAEFVCRIGMVDGIADRKTPPDYAHDPRIKALSIAAPGFGFAFPDQSLAAVKFPVEIWSGALDDRVPHATNGALLAEALPNVKRVHVADGAGHFAFLAPCNPRLEAANPRIWQMVCVDAAGFDRAAFHEELNRAILGFFDENLGPPR
ncbi:MAG: hypothetical protein AAGB11_07100 [Pseudomonadota bacterium]